MSASPERAKVLDFTDQVYAYGEGAFVPGKDKISYSSIQAIQGYHVGAQVGTCYLDLLQKSGVLSEVRSYETIADIITDVAAGPCKRASLMDRSSLPVQPCQLSQGPARQ
jgi:polar amino acid transport system substrate-binding protein